MCCIFASTFSAGLGAPGFAGAMRPGFRRCLNLTRGPGFGRDAPRVSALPQPGLLGVFGLQRWRFARVGVARVRPQAVTRDFTCGRGERRGVPGFGRDAPRVSALPQPGLLGVFGVRRCQVVRAMANCCCLCVVAPAFPSPSPESRLHLASSQALTFAAMPAKIMGSLPEGYPSGQRGQTVNLLAYAFGGSNPPPSTSRGCAVPFHLGGSSSMVELQPSKLIVRVRFPSPAPLNAAWHELAA